ncbi:MAG: hypothetical protein ACXABY_00205 [Candidatus Thorarchaeota archaeon]|jgi:hypothetical protein
MMDYNVSADIDWPNRNAHFSVSYTGTLPAGLTVGLIDRQGQWVLNEQPTSTAVQGTAYASLPLTPYPVLRETFSLTGLPTGNANNETAGNLTDSSSSSHLGTIDDMYSGKKLTITRGDFVDDVTVNSVSSTTMTVDVSTIDLKRGDFVYDPSIALLYRVVSDTTVGDPDLISLDRTVDDNVIGNNVDIYPTVTVTGYNSTSKILEFSALTAKTNIAGTSYAQGVSVVKGAGYRDIGVPSTDITGNISIRSGDHVDYTDSIDGPRTEEILSVISTTGFTIADNGAGNPDEGSYTVYRAMDYMMQESPTFDVGMTSLLIQSGSILHAQEVPPSRPTLEINFNEYDSSVTSIGTLSHFHIGPVLIGGQVVTGGVQRCEATLLAGDTSVQETWNIDTEKAFSTASASTGIYYMPSEGVFVLTSSATFSTADMLTLKASIIVNDEAVSRTVTVPVQPVI